MESIEKSVNSSITAAQPSSWKIPIVSPYRGSNRIYARAIILCFTCRIWPEVALLCRLVCTCAPAPPSSPPRSRTVSQDPVRAQIQQWDSSVAFVGPSGSPLFNIVRFCTAMRRLRIPCRGRKRSENPLLQGNYSQLLLPRMKL